MANNDIAMSIEAFFAAYPERSLSSRQILISAGEKPNKVSYITHGTVRQYDITTKGEEVVVNVFKKGAFFPVAHIVNDMPNDYFFEAAEDLIVRQAPIDDVLAFLKGNPDVLLDLLRRVFSGIDGILHRQAQLMNGTALSRLSFELIIAYRRFGRQLDDGSWQVDGKEADFATRTGLTRETISRCLHKLRDAGCVEVVRGGVIIKDIAKLEREATAELAL